MKDLGLPIKPGDKIYVFGSILPENVSKTMERVYGGLETVTDVP